MNRNYRITHAITVLVFTLISTTATTRADEPSAACSLYTKTDAEALFKQTVTDGVSRKTIMPAGDSCRYNYSQNGDTYSLNLKVSNSDEIKNEGIQDSAADVMQRQEAARKNSPYAAKQFQKIPNLGTDAFWSGEDLWVLQDETLIIISVHSFLNGSFPNMDAARQARGKQDLDLSLQVAKTVLLNLR
jgi:hypothetical protein